jgi:hypothetical protein
MVDGLGLSRLSRLATRRRDQTASLAGNSDSTQACLVTAAGKQIGESSLNLHSRTYPTPHERQLAYSTLHGNLIPMAEMASGSGEMANEGWDMGRRDARAGQAWEPVPTMETGAAGEIEQLGR